jgi:hypothetical protein
MQASLVEMDRVVKSLDGGRVNTNGMPGSLGIERIRVVLLPLDLGGDGVIGSK